MTKAEAALHAALSEFMIILFMGEAYCPACDTDDPAKLSAGWCKSGDEEVLLHECACGAVWTNDDMCAPLRQHRH